MIYYNPSLKGKNKNKSFTLLELLIVISILAIISSIIILVINPAEAIRKSRDTRRINDLNSINSLVNLYLIDNPEGFSFSIDDPDICTSRKPCKSYCCVRDGSYICDGSCSKKESMDLSGSGWIPIDFSSNISGGSPITNLPIDPVNDNNYYYIFVKGSPDYEINTKLESSYYTDKKKLAQKDGGNTFYLYEIGSNLNLYIDPTNVLWLKFDEGSGNTAKDSSEYQNDGTIYGATWSNDCISGSCLSFDGVDDYVEVPDSSSLSPVSEVTVVAWVYRTGAGSGANAGVVAKIIK